MKSHGDEFRKTNYVSPQQSKTIFAISNCRTSVYGAHKDLCDECGYERISYNSCRNRHCPKCQSFAKENWIEKQQQNLLNVQYFHAVFTVPDDLNIVFMQNQTTMYNLLFKAVSETLMELSKDMKYLGATPGITIVLHTWGQSLNFHPHLHCIITGGGLSECGKWINSRKKFFIPVKVMSKKFRGKFMYYFNRAKIKFFGSAKHLKNDIALADFVNHLYKKDWIVYCKPPFGNANKVIDYLGRYTHRVAISNNRIVKHIDDTVSFNWRDYTDNNKGKVMTLSVNEFIRRFLMHVLPLGFRKIRHFGIFASRDKSKRIILCKKLTNTKILITATDSVMIKLSKIFGSDFNLCPSCKSGHLSRASPMDVN